MFQLGGLEPFSALPAPKQHWLWGNLYDFTINKRLQFHLVCQRWHQQLGPIYRCAALSSSSATCLADTNRGTVQCAADSPE